jgi:mRNA interferase MazF
MTLHRADIVLVNFPFSSGAGAKVRPALVVQPDRNDRRLTNTIIAMITSHTDKAQAEPAQLLIELASPTGKRSGLLHDSAVKCENLFTIEQSLIRRVIGSLPPEAMKQVDASLKAALGLQ